jgi:preprotein translocase subunit YajC
MNALIPAAWAQSGSAGGANSLAPMLIMVVFVAVFYFILIRPQQKQVKEHQALLSRLSTGDEVVTSGGVLGKITEVGDVFVTLELAEGVRVKVQKAKIAQLMPKGTLKNA